MSKVPSLQVHARRYIPVDLLHVTIPCVAAVFPSVVLNARLHHWKAVFETAPLPEHLNDELVWLVCRAIRDDHLSLASLPTAFLDGSRATIYYEAVKANGLNLQYVPRQDRTESLCQAAVRHNGLALEYVPEEMRTVETAHIALHNNGLALQYMKVFNGFLGMPDLRLFLGDHVTRGFLGTPRLCYTALLNTPHAYKYIPKSMWTLSLCRVAANAGLDALHTFPETTRTPAICLIALQSKYTQANADGTWGRDKQTLLSYMPVPSRTLEVCMDAIRRDRASIVDLPHNLQTEPVFLKLLSFDGLLLRHIDTRYHTPEVFLMAVTQTCEALFLVPDVHLTDDLIHVALQQDPTLFAYLPRQKRSYAVCLAGVQRRGELLKYVPSSNKDTSVCHIAVRQNPDALRWIPWSLLPLEVALDIAEGAVRAKGKE